MAKKMSKRADSGTLGGFTIIEVVLVLAIAGLIFMMVFIALPGLQRSQRDTQRRENLGRVTSAIMDYQTNNNGSLPSTGKVPAFSTDNGRQALSELRCSGSGTTRNGAACLLKNYLNSTNATENSFEDPLGCAYGLEIAPFADYDEDDFSKDMDYTIRVFTGAKCNGEFAEKSNNARDYVVMYRLEGAGTYCRDNGTAR